MLKLLGELLGGGLLGGGLLGGGLLGGGLRGGGLLGGGPAPKNKRGESNRTGARGLFAPFEARLQHAYILTEAIIN